jgi:hypothetical protein
MLRGVAFMAGLLAAAPAVAGEMGAEEARRFVIGKLFSYECFEGTRGMGRIYSDGSVIGSIQMRGSGPVRYAHLPAGTIQVKGESVCASLRGLPFSPCFSLDKTSESSFRGAIYGMGFASCQFTRRVTHADLSEEQRPAPAAAKRAHASAAGAPTKEAAATPTKEAAATSPSAGGAANASEPLNLRPSIADGAP